MQTHVYLRQPKKTLEERPAVEPSPVSGNIRKVTHATIRGVDLHQVKSDTPSRKPGRILDNLEAGYIDKTGPPFTEI
jgi:hypothetical protein